jgi:hypothetical protein
MGASSEWDRKEIWKTSDLPRGEKDVLRCYTTIEKENGPLSSKEPF